MSDLIERLRMREAHEKTIPSFGHNAADRERAELIRLLSEAAAALEAAREESDRWRGRYRAAIVQERPTPTEAADREP